MHERECKGYISFNRGVNELNRGVNELNRGVNDLNRGVNHSVARQGCNLLRAAVTSAVTSQGCCCGNLQIHPLDLGQYVYNHIYCKLKLCNYNLNYCICAASTWPIYLSQTTKTTRHCSTEMLLHSIEIH